MHVSSARHGISSLHLRIDGHHVTAGEKYTIIEMGYAILIGVDESSHAWLNSISEALPANDDSGRGPLRGGDGMAVTSDPVIVALTYTNWWARNTEGFKAGRSLRISTLDEAALIVRNRKILNDFNRRYAGKLPSEW